MDQERDDYADPEPPRRGSALDPSVSGLLIAALAAVVLLLFFAAVAVYYPVRD
jgi:hypothetical protein